MKDTKFTDELLGDSQDQECEIFRALFFFKNKHMETLKVALVYPKKRNENDKTQNKKQQKTPKN